MPDAVIAVEPFACTWPEAQPMAEAHFREVERDMPSGRRFKLKAAALEQASRLGSLLVITARIDGKLIGYLTWSIQEDWESEGLIIALHGPWYVEPGYPRVAVAMLDRSEPELKLRSVKCALTIS